MSLNSDSIFQGTTPAITATGQLTLTVVVSDPRGASDSDSTSVTVQVCDIIG